MTLYFEDFSVGDEFEFGQYTITKAEIVEFASQFDPQPFHLDEDAAKESIFGELIASGLHTLCLSVRLSVEEFFDDVANLGGLGLDNLRWHHPVKPGDTLSIRMTVREKSMSESRPERGYVTFERDVLVDGDQKVMSVESHTIIQRRPERT